MSALPDTEALAKLLAETTPGPWQSEHPDDEESDGSRYIASTVSTVCRETAVCKLRSDQGADARLIALAPALAAQRIADAARIAQLEAALRDRAVTNLRNVVTWLQEDPDNIHHLDQADVAKMRAWLNGTALTPAS